jgi:hypothetical protein
MPVAIVIDGKEEIIYLYVPPSDIPDYDLRKDNRFCHTSFADLPIQIR